MNPCTVSFVLEVPKWNVKAVDDSIRNSVFQSFRRTILECKLMKCKSYFEPIMIENTMFGKNMADISRKPKIIQFYSCNYRGRYGKLTKSITFFKNMIRKEQS